MVPFSCTPWLVARVELEQQERLRSEVDRRRWLSMGAGSKSGRGWIKASGALRPPAFPLPFAEPRGGTPLAPRKKGRPRRGSEGTARAFLLARRRLGEDRCVFMIVQFLRDRGYSLKRRQQGRVANVRARVGYAIPKARLLFQQLGGFSCARSEYAMEEAYKRGRRLVLASADV